MSRSIVNVTKDGRREFAQSALKHVIVNLIWHNIARKDNSHVIKKHALSLFVIIIVYVIM
jgi:hypothetical protein